MGKLKHLCNVLIKNVFIHYGIKKKKNYEKYIIHINKS